MKVLADFAELIRRAHNVLGPPGMDSNTSRVTVDYTCGFEAFNDQPYQCYETWCCGVKVSCLQADGKTKHFRQYEHAKQPKDFAELCYPEVAS